MLIVDQEATALLAATVNAAGCRYAQAIFGADCVTSRRMTARPFGLWVTCSRKTTLETPPPSRDDGECLDGWEVVIVKTIWAAHAHDPGEQQSRPRWLCKCQCNFLKLGWRRRTTSPQPPAD
jgi:hypothetical protein